MKVGIATMDDRLWSSLEQSGFQFLGELKGHFLTPWHVACAVDSLDDTANLRLPISWSELDLSVLLPLLKYCNFRDDLDQAKVEGSTRSSSTGIRFEKSVWG